MRVEVVRWNVSKKYQLKVDKYLAVVIQNLRLHDTFLTDIVLPAINVINRFPKSFS